MRISKEGFQVIRRWRTLIDQVDADINERNPISASLTLLSLSTELQKAAVVCQNAHIHGNPREATLYFQNALLKCIPDNII